VEQGRSNGHSIQPANFVAPAAFHGVVQICFESEANAAFGELTAAYKDAQTLFTQRMNKAYEVALSKAAAILGSRCLRDAQSGTADRESELVASASHPAAQPGERAAAGNQGSLKSHGEKSNESAMRNIASPSGHPPREARSFDEPLPESDERMRVLTPPRAAEIFIQHRATGQNRNKTAPRRVENVTDGTRGQSSADSRSSGGLSGRYRESARGKPHLSSDENQPQSNSAGKTSSEAQNPSEGYEVPKDAILELIPTRGIGTTANALCMKTGQDNAAMTALLQSLIGSGKVKESASYAGARASASRYKRVQSPRPETSATVE
jgi:hypothetical protein